VSLEFRLLGVTRFVAEVSELYIKNGAALNAICASMSILNAGAMGSVQLSFLAILVERSIATCYHANYDDWKNGLSKAFTLLELIYALFFGFKVS
jgi:hypothetical protein